MKHLAIIIALTGLAACAQPPASIKPAKVTSSEPCENLPFARAELAKLTKEQREVVATDLMTSSLFLLPAASMAGASKADEISVVKGRIAAMEEQCK